MLAALFCAHATASWSCVPVAAWSIPGADGVQEVAVGEVLARALGHASGLLTVFAHEGMPFQVAEGSMQPLERRALAKLEVERVDIKDVSAEAVLDPSIVNDPVGRFALWGFPAMSDKKLLPSGE